MPAYKASDEEMGMDESYGNAPVKAPAKTPPESIDQENQEDAELLADKKDLPDDVKEGDKCLFEVIADYGDQVSLKYVKPNESAKTESTPSDDTASELAALDNEGTE